MRSCKHSPVLYQRFVRRRPRFSIEAAARAFAVRSRTRIDVDSVGMQSSKRNSQSEPWNRHSIAALSFDADANISDEALELDKDAFAGMVPRPLSVQDIIDMRDPKKLAKFMHVESPIRYAERIRWIEQIPKWWDIPELKSVHEQHFKAFRGFRTVKRKPNLDAFTDLVQEIIDEQAELQHVITRGMKRLQIERGEMFGSRWADPFLDKFLLSRIGTDMLLQQYLACYSAHAEGAMDSDGNIGGLGTQCQSQWYSGGIIDMECDPAEVARRAASETVATCMEITGKAPLVLVEVYAPWDKGNVKCSFSYIPGFLKYILLEVLKNSCRATAEMVKNDRMLKKHPVRVIVCADANQVAIRVADRARGIPFEDVKDVWSYLYSTVKKRRRRAGEDNVDEPVATALAGYGVGLPLSRLHAKYLGGHMRLVSLPGYGTSVDIVLPRVCAELVEVVPDDDND